MGSFLKINLGVAVGTAPWGVGNWTLGWWSWGWELRLEAAGAGRNGFGGVATEGKRLLHLGDRERVAGLVVRERRCEDHAVDAPIVCQQRATRVAGADLGADGD